MKKYYSTLRPLGMGCFPKPQGNPVWELCNFKQKTIIGESGREAYGYIIYEYPLSGEDIKKYDLVEG